MNLINLLFNLQSSSLASTFLVFLTFFILLTLILLRIQGERVINSCSNCALICVELKVGDSLIDTKISLMEDEILQFLKSCHYQIQPT